VFVTVTTTILLTLLIGAGTMLTLVSTRQPCSGALQRLDENTASAKDMATVQSCSQDFARSAEIAGAGGSLVGSGGPVPSTGAAGFVDSVVKPSLDELASRATVPRPVADAPFPGRRAVASSSGAPLELFLPNSITVTETSRYGTFTNTWKLNGDKHSYAGSDTRGVKSEVTVRRFDPSGAVFERKDTAGPSNGLTATYTGTRSGNSLSGSVDFSFSDGHGIFKADW
jgi:hypothetical protein